MRKMFLKLSVLLTLVTGTVSVLADNVEVMPKVPAGSVERMHAFHSAFVDARNVDVWLPSGYSSSKRYNVLYMQDGQMLYDPERSWNKQAWRVDQVMTRLRSAGLVPDTIVVGIWNNGSWRHSEYFPEKALGLMAEPMRSQFINKGLAGKSLADQYLRFVVGELKPAIDRKYSTLPDRDHTFLMGSSMGGLISLYALSEYPNVFGGAACLSTHWPGSFEANAAIPMALFNYLQTHLPDPAHHRIYMDRGTETLDALYAMPQPVVDQILRDKGYDETNFMTRVFSGASHTENDWSGRLDLPLQFILNAKTAN